MTTMRPGRRSVGGRVVLLVLLVLVLLVEVLVVPNTPDMDQAASRHPLHEDGRPRSRWARRRSEERAGLLRPRHSPHLVVLQVAAKAPRERRRPRPRNLLAAQL
jgi:hypothetical protein